ncbi:MAG: hypothetical protein ABIQ74_01675 [Chitinophagales bacterium]
MKRIFLSSVILLVIINVLQAQNVGIGISAPTQKLDVSGNVQFTGALMPGGSAGTLSQILTSNGPGLAPAWTTTASSTGWLLTGNAATVPGTNFIGTTDLKDWVIKTNNLERMRIASGGSVGINVTPTTTEMLTVAGGTSYNGIRATTTKTATGSYALHVNGKTGLNGYGGYVGTITVSGLGVDNPPLYATTNVTGFNAQPAILGVTVTGGNTSAIIGESDVWNGGNFISNLGSAIALVGNNAVAANASNTGTGVLGVTGGAFGWGVWGYNSQKNGTGIKGENYLATTTTGTGNGVLGLTPQSAGAGVSGKNTNTSGTGIIGAGNNVTAVYLVAGSGGAFTGTGTGIFAVGTTVLSGTGIIGAGNNSASVTLAGGSGGSFTGTSTGIYGKASTAATGIGILAAGNGATALVPITGGGGAFTGTGTGTYSIANLATGTGVVSGGNNVTPTVLVSGSGGAFTGLTTGLYANSTLTVGAAEAIYSVENGTVVRVNYWDGTTQWKIAGTGTMPVGCTVKDDQGIEREMFAMESPEFLFSDYGEGQLVNGFTHITLDPIISKNISVTSHNPLRVFVQLEGNCKGVYVTNKSSDGFDVVELDGGNSNTPFQYQVICNVKDVQMDNGKLNHLADIRFKPANSNTLVSDLPAQSARSIQGSEAIIPAETNQRSYLQPEGNLKNSPASPTAPGNE